MVNLSSIAQGRKPLLIYGVKRGKVPTKLRPHLLPQKEDVERAKCLNELYNLLNCWKSNAYEDQQCSQEISSFMNCVTEEIALGKSKSGPEWTRDEINATLKYYTPYLRRPRSH